MPAPKKSTTKIPKVIQDDDSFVTLKKCRRFTQGPKRITIVPDEWHLPHVGRTKKGERFFLTTPFEPGTCEYVALYVWDMKGQFRYAKIKKMGKRGSYKVETKVALIQSMLDSLGPRRTTTIKVEPIAVSAFGTLMGFIYEDDQEGYKTVSLEPGNYVVFNPPWDGNYDT